VYAAHYLKVNEEANYIKVNKKGKKDPGIEWRTEQLAWGGIALQWGTESPRMLLQLSKEVNKMRQN